MLTIEKWVIFYIAVLKKAKTLSQSCNILKFRNVELFVSILLRQSSNLMNIPRLYVPRQRTGFEICFFFFFFFFALFFLNPLFSKI